MLKASQVAIKLQSNIQCLNPHTHTHTRLSHPMIALSLHTSPSSHPHRHKHTHTCSAETQVTWRRHLQEFLLLLLDRGEDMRLEDEARRAFSDGMRRESTHTAHSTTLLPLILTRTHTHTHWPSHTHTPSSRKRCCSVRRGAVRDAVSKCVCKVFSVLGGKPKNV